MEQAAIWPLSYWSKWFCITSLLDILWCVGRGNIFWGFQPKRINAYARQHPSFVALGNILVEALAAFSVLCRKISSCWDPSLRSIFLTEAEEQPQPSILTEHETIHMRWKFWGLVLGLLQWFDYMLMMGEAFVLHSAWVTVINIDRCALLLIYFWQSVSVKLLNDLDRGSSAYQA